MLKSLLTIMVTPEMYDWLNERAKLSGLQVENIAEGILEVTRECDIKLAKFISENTIKGGKDA